MANFLNDNLKYLRTTKGISQQELADKIGIDRSTVSRIENKEIETTLENAIKISEVLNIPLHDLIGKNLKIDNSPPVKEEHEKYKQILKSKGLMDENENINEESLNKLLKIADMIEGINNKED